MLSGPIWGVGQGETDMRKIALAIAALILMESIAWAACPPGTRYVCTQGFNGKVICSCV